MNILVTGNLGYIGPVLVNRLKKNNHHIIGFDSWLYRDDQFGPFFNEYLPHIQVFGDLRDNKLLESIFSRFRPDAVVHLAALSNDALGELNESLTYDINFKSTINLAKIAKKYNSSYFVFASSCSVYGRVEDFGKRISENFKTNPLTAYAISKVKSEKQLSELADKDFKIAILRNATMFGFSPFLRLDLVLNNLVARAYLFNEIKILSDGTPWRPLIHVKDFSEIVARFIKEKISGTFNVGFNEENYQIKTLGDIISKRTGAKLSINKSKTPDERSYSVDFSKLANELDMDRPEIDVTKGVEELLDAFDSFGLRKDDFSSKYFRINRLKKLISNGRLDQDLFWRE